MKNITISIVITFHCDLFNYLLRMNAVIEIEPIFFDMKFRPELMNQVAEGLLYRDVARRRMKCNFIFFALKIRVKSTQRKHTSLL